MMILLKFFFPYRYSTFTATVCKARGTDIVSDSNTCRTLTNRGNDLFFVNAEHKGLASDWKEHWQFPENKMYYEKICEREFDAEDKGITLKF